MNAKNAEESSKTNPRMRVYYDGLCPLCSREIAYYLSKEGSGAINWIDITENGFDPVVE
jgi:predicted DCC family thiol-disulfide oxidoreductase YuxK